MIDIAFQVQINFKKSFEDQICVDQDNLLCSLRIEWDKSEFRNTKAMVVAKDV